MRKSNIPDHIFPVNAKLFLIVAITSTFVYAGLSSYWKIIRSTLKYGFVENTEYRLIHGTAGK